MKLSALAAQIKNCGHCEVINNGGRIFIGTGSAFYCMDGYPRTQVRESWALCWAFRRRR